MGTATYQALVVSTVATTFTVCCLMLYAIRQPCSLYLAAAAATSYCCLLFILFLAVNDAVITVVAIILFC